MIKRKLSLIIPCYNVTETIDNLATLILSQYDKETTEIICVDDGSTDGTYEKLQKFSNKLKIIKTCHQGVSAARNVGLNSANGEWVWFVDGDDLLFDGAFETINKYWNDESVEVLFFGAKILNNPISKERLLDIAPPNERLFETEIFPFWINLYPYPYVWNCLYKLKFLRNNNLCFSSELEIGEDMAFQMSVFARAKEVQMIKDPIYVYRYLFNNKSSMSNALKTTRIPFHLKVVEEVFDNNRKLLNKYNRNLLFKWAYHYVVGDCFKNPHYLPCMVKIWRKNKAKFPYSGLKNKIKAFLLYSCFFSRCYAIYKIAKTKQD